MKSVSAWAVIMAVFLTVAAIWFIRATNDFTFNSAGPQGERVVEIRNLTVVGYRGEERAWKIKAGYTWSGYDKNVGHFENLFEGTLYEEGKIIMNQLRANRGRGDSQRAWLQAEDGVASDIYLLQDKGVRRMQLSCQKLFYNSTIQRTIVQDAVRLKYEGTTIETDEAEIDHRTNTVIIHNGFVMWDEQSWVQGQQMEANLKTQIAVVKSHVSLVMSANVERGHATTLNCGHMVFTLNEDDGQTVQFRDNVRFRQHHYDAFAWAGDYDQRSGRLNLQQRIELALMDTGTVIRCEQLQALLSTPDQALIWAEFSGRTDIQEQDKSINARKGSYTVADEALRLTGDVHMTVHQFRNLIRKESADRIDNPQAADVLSKPAMLDCDYLYLDRKSQNAEAVGNVLVVQKEQQARAERAQYVENEDIIYLDDQVSIMKESGEWVQADRVVAHLQDEAFEAMGAVDTQFILKGKER